jgi:hypothetical protein
MRVIRSAALDIRSELTRGVRKLVKANGHTIFAWGRHRDAWHFDHWLDDHSFGRRAKG